MPTRKSPRKGSLQFWPRKRANKLLPRVNWDAIDSGKNLKGFIGYKRGMVSAYVKDVTNNSMTKGKNIFIPATIIECPPMKIFSVRLYKGKKLVKDILTDNLDKELKKKVKLPKEKKKSDIPKKSDDFDDVKVICYSNVKVTGLKKKPDLNEIGLKGNLDDKINFVKEHLNKPINVEDVFDNEGLVDIRGVTKGKGFQGPVKRFGITLRFHKSEKGVRKVGSIGPWHPARVTFRVPMAGQTGMQTRVIYNNKILAIGKAENTKVGNIKTSYILVRGSVLGPAKRQMIITHPLRESKMQIKKKYEFIEIK